MAGLFTAAARRHINRLRRTLAPLADPLERRFRAELLARGWNTLQAGAWLAVAPTACARAPSLTRFLEQVDRNGRRLAHLNVSLDDAVDALEQFGRVIESALEGRFEPAREQLQLATRLVLDRVFFREEVLKRACLEAEVRRLEAEARHAEEAERRRLGRELHDEAGQALMLLRLQLEMIGRDAPPELRARLAEARDLAGRTAVELRRIVAALSPAVLERLGLEAALRHLAGRFGKLHPARVHLRVRLRNEALARPVEEVVYRVTQECLHNIARHSRATAVNLDLHAADKNIELSVSDNGAGFCADQVGGKMNSFGLAGMRERAELLGGTLRVVTRPGQGTRIRLQLPLHHAPAVSNGKIRVLLTDDHTLFRQGVRTLLSSEADIEVVGEAADASQAVALARQFRPDVVLMDIGMAGMSCFEATRQIRKLRSETKVVFLSMYDDEDYLAESVEIGASGFILKECPADQLVTAIREVHRGGNYLSPRLLTRLVDGFREQGRSPVRPTRLGTLTKREREVTKLLAEGKSVKEVAADFDLSVKTIEAHKFNLMRKLNIHNKAQLVQYAIQKKIIRLPEPFAGAG